MPSRTLLVASLLFAVPCLFAACADDGDTIGQSDTMTSQDGTTTGGECGGRPCNTACCDDQCVDVSLDARHCGACGNACASGAICLNGICAGDCDGGFVCAGECVDITASPAHCGTCNRACGDAQVCANGECADGCPAGLAACSGACVNTSQDEANCGSCGFGCLGGQTCEDSTCVCATGFQDCDGDPANGCESQGNCACNPGETRPCYSGAPGTENVGACVGGVETCDADGSGWGICAGEVRPALEVCNNNADDDCDGTVDEDPDVDGDGFTVCGGDCCDDPTTGCAVDPSKVNPAALDFAGNFLDDDCDGTPDNPPSLDCTSTEKLSGTTGIDLARAMGFCLDASTAGWGLVSAELVRADGSGTPDNAQVGVLADLGGVIPAHTGPTMAALSSGTARGPGQNGYLDPLNASLEVGTSVSAPAAYLAANGGQLQTNPACDAGSSTVNDSATLRLTLRAPSNAEGFSYNFRFLSSEYPIWLCSEYNDFFLALLNSAHPDVPSDGNISFDMGGNPVSVNNAFFTTCEPQACNYGFSGADNDFDGCPDSLDCVAGQCATSLGACPDGAADIAGYALDNGEAGGTSWLTTTAGILPGEEFTLEFHIWDTSDMLLDSIVLLDNFEWRIEPTEVATFN